VVACVARADAGRLTAAALAAVIALTPAAANAGLVSMGLSSWGH
jgi:hypothetical protein